MYKVTAIITTHNRSSILANAIESVLVQTFRNFELLVIDDASIDDTEEIVKTFVDERIKYIKISPEESKGGNYARNIGIKEARGEYIAFLDDDDEWLPIKLEKQLEVFNKDEKIGFVYTGLEYVLYEGKAHTKLVPKAWGRGDLSRRILISYINSNTSSFMVKKDKLIEAGLFDINMPALQDYDMCIRLCQICSVDFTKEVLTKYIFRDSIHRIGKCVEKYEEASLLLEKKYEHLYLLLDKKSRKDAKLMKYKNLLFYSFASNNKKKVRKYSMKYLSKKFDFMVFARLCFSYIGIDYFHKIKYLFLLINNKITKKI